MGKGAFAVLVVLIFVCGLTAFLFGKSSLFVFAPCLIFLAFYLLIKKVWGLEEIKVFPKQLPLPRQTSPLPSDEEMDELVKRLTRNGQRIIKRERLWLYKKLRMIGGRFKKLLRRR